MKECSNCGRLIDKGSRCNNCYQYRSIHGVERPVELETKRARINTPNEEEKCINCKRQLPKKYAKLCHACYVWQQRHNGEMRPVEQESKLLSPKIEIKKEPKPRPCQKCLARKRKGFTSQCPSCIGKRVWLEGKMSHRRYTPKPNQWRKEHTERLLELAGTMPVKYIAERLTEEFGINRTEHAVEVYAIKHGISIMYCGTMTVLQVAYILNISYGYVLRFLNRGLLKGYKENQTRYGKWHITRDNIEQFVREYPFLIDRTKIRNSRLRSIAEGEFFRDPWLPRTQIAKILGVCQWVVDGYIKQGILETTYSRKNLDRIGWKVLVYRSSMYEFMKRRDEQVS